MKKNPVGSQLTSSENWENIYCYVKSLFLDATESNINDLFEDINTVFASFS